MNTTRPCIATYAPQRSLEAAGAGTLYGPAATPQQLAELTRALQLLESAQGQPGVMTTVNDRMSACVQTFMIEKKALGLPPPDAGSPLEVRFDEGDLLGWAGVFFSWLKGHKRFDWQTPGEPETLPEQCRIALLGDWGTGLYGAPVCAKSIARDGNYAVVMHLGDVYYAGTEDEMQQRFHALWPNVQGAKNRALNGNHEMYTGGQAYAGVLKRFEQQASYFAFQNENWILAALDTAYSEHDLYGEQAAWLQTLARQAPQKRLVLFSHHQPYSLLDAQGPALVAILAPLLTEQRIFAWYWGHEHHCMLYQPHALWGLRGRCVGHGGFPYYRETKVLGDAAPAEPTWKNLRGKHLVPAAHMLDGMNEYVDRHPQHFGPNGYMTLEFDGPELFEIVHAPDGTSVWAQPIAL